jgi:hypothetical protein
MKSFKFSLLSLCAFSALTMSFISIAEPGEPDTNVISCRHNGEHFAYTRVSNTCEIKHIQQSATLEHCVELENGVVVCHSGEQSGEDCVITEEPLD